LTGINKKNQSHSRLLYLGCRENLKGSKAIKDTTTCLENSFNESPLAALVV
jgi:hypothetical protein